jgi:phosphoglycolate phosphatase
LIRAVFFDLDGTLVDSAADLATATNAMLRELGLPERPVEEIRSFIGEGSRNLVERSIAPRGDLIDTALPSWTEHYERVLLHATRPYPGMLELLESLVNGEWTLAVHTNKPSGMAREILRGLGMESSFAHVLGSDDGPARKPSAEGTQFLLEKLKLQASEVVYVGDSRIDGETARAAGIPFIGVRWGFRPEAELRDAGARFVVTDAGDLAGVLRGLRPQAP